MKTLKKCLSLFLVIVTIFTTCSVAVPVFAAETEKETEAVPTEEAVVSKPEILYEITDDRTANTKSFMQSDGTKLITQYQENVHYENADGEFIEYDNTLTETETDANEKEYKTKDSDIDIRISKKTNGKKLVRVTKGNDTLSWSFADISKVTGKVSEKTADDDVTSLENFASEVTFSDVFKKTDLQYVIYGDSLKENIILNGKDSPDEFRIEYKYSGLTPLLSEDKKTIYLNNSENETVFVISAPFMTDSNGEENIDLFYDLGEIKNNQFTATLICDTEWLDDENRAYPVTVDPVIITEQTWDNSDYQSAYISSYLPDACFGRGGANYEGSLYVGYEYTSESNRREMVRSLIRFSLPTLNKGDRVVGATMLTYLNACYPATTVNLYEVTSSWAQSTVTWNSQPSIDPVISEYKAIPYTDTSAADFIEWDITKLVNSWYIGASTNYGIMLKSPAENSSSTHRARFYSSGYTTESAARPLIAISVRNMTGYEDYYSYSEFNAGTAGTAYINNFTGNLMFAHNDIGTSGVLMPVSVSNVYNTTLAGANPKTYPHVGYGKKLSLLQTVKPSSKYGLTGDSATSFPYAYEDGDGTVHYFYKTTENGATKYYDEDGLNLELTFSDTEYIITDKQGNKKIFYKSTYLLKEEKNADGVSVIYNYTTETLSSGSTRTFLSSVKDGAGHIIYLYYDKESGRLSSMKGPDGNSISYTYQSGYNTKITYSDGTSSTYTYSSGLLTSAKSSDGYQLTFTYSSDSVKAVESVTEKGGTATGNYVEITRSSPYQTEMRSSGQDRTYGNSDDIITTYQFDTYGRVASAKTALGSGEVVSYGSYDFTMGAQNNATDIKKRNRVESASAVGKNANNLLVNHSFEVTGDGNWTANYWLDSAYANSSSAALSTEEAYLGQQSLKINVASAPGTGGYTMYQNALSRVESGKTYTASIYVKTQSVTKKSGATTYGAGFVVRAVGSSGTTSWYSDMLTGTTSTAVDNGWQRLEVTFTTPAGLTSFRIMPMIYCATGTAYFDCVQLEEGEAANGYNLLKNSDFELSSSGWNSENIETADTLSTAAHNTGAKSFLINGASDKAKAIKQTVGVSSNEDDTYIVSGFAKASASPDSSDNNERLFAISVKIVYTDGTSKTKYPAYFNYAVTDWQHVSGVFTLSDEDSSTQKTPKNVTVYCNYKNQTNTCYFDDICLIKEPVPTYKYDSDGNLISAVENAEKTSSLTYDANDNLTALQDEKNVNYTYTYASTGNTHQLTSATDNFTGIKYNFTYDENNGNLIAQNITSSTGSPAIKTEIKYSDASGAIKAGAYLYRDIDEHGRSTYYNYNTASGLLDSVKDANGYITNYTYNQNNGLLTKVLNGSSSVNYVYDSTYTKLMQISRTGGSYTFTYDSFGNSLQTLVGNTPLITNTYAPKNGLLQLSTYGNSDKRYYTYDAPGRLIGIKNNDTDAYSWTYSGSGVPNTYTDIISGRKYKYTYDSLGRIISQTGKNISGGSDKTSSTYTYDISNNLTKLVNSAGSLSLTMNYYYDSVNRPTKSYYTSNTQETYTYDSLGRLSSSSLKLTSSTLSKSYVFHNSANYSGKTTNQIKTENLGDRGYQYTYDRVGNITAIKEKTTAAGNFNDKVSYTYDNLNQLTRENNKDLNKTLTYSYDGNGNITSVKEYAYTTGTVSSPTKTITYTYDGTWKDKLVNYNGQSITYDSIGNPLTYRDGMTFSWFGRQMESANVNGTAITYKYNADGLRTEKTVGSTVSKYEYTGDKLFYEKRGNLEFHYRYDVFGNLASITRVNADGTSFSLYTVCNSRGDVEELRRSTGELFARYVYDSWGNVLHIYDINGAEITSTANFAVQNPFRYRGYYYDTETGLYYLQSRYYDPVTHRFLNADNQLATTDITGVNLFAYCGNNPVNRIDPTGEAWLHWALGALVVGICAAATIATCGGFAAAVSAVGMVASGMAAATTASTVAAAAFIGSATAYGTAVVVAAMSSTSVEEFRDQGTWGTVVTTTLSAVSYGTYGYEMAVQQNSTISKSTYSSNLHLSGTSSPKNNAIPNGSYTQYDNSGKIYSYAQYNSLGQQSLRIDFQGKSHAGVLPHIHLFLYPERGGKHEYIFDMNWHLIN